MQNKYLTIYEGAQLEHFERSIMSGFLTESKLGDMIDAGELSNDQRAIAEGFFDRLKARGSQAVAGAAGLGKQAIGGVQRAAGNAVQGAGNLAAKGVEALGGQIDPANNKVANYGQDLRNQGISNQSQGQAAGEIAKTKSYLNNAVATVVNDFKKLNIPIKDEQAFVADLQKLFISHIAGANPRTNQLNVRTNVGGNNINRTSGNLYK